jgi:nucleotide-binding universal stress UspA family protein
MMREVPITLIHAIAPAATAWPIGPVQASIAEWQRDNAKQVIEQARKTVFATTGESLAPDVFTEVFDSNIVVSVLVEASRKSQIVVTGSRGLGAVGRILLGSVSAGLVNHAHCPVAVIHGFDEPAAASEAPILLGVDGSPASEQATALAFDEASRRNVPLLALHAWSDVAVFPALGMDWHKYEDQGREALGERLAGWQEQYPEVTVRRRLYCDRPAPLAHRGIPPRSTCDRRQPWARRIRWHAARFSELRRRSIGICARDRRPKLSPVLLIGRQGHCDRGHRDESRTFPTQFSVYAASRT